MDGNSGVLLILCVLLNNTDAAKTVGPFETSFSDLKRCPEPSEGVAYSIKLVKAARQKVLVLANVSFTVPVDDELDVLINLSKQTSQGWKENFFILEAPKACTSMKQYIPGMVKQLGMQLKTPGNTCPYPVGNFSVAVDLHFSFGVFPVFPYGKYLAKVNLMKKSRKRAYCMILTVDVAPKKSG